MSHPVMLQGIRLAAAKSDLTWSMVAYEGEFRGYAGGEKPFALTEEMFETVVDNFHANPRYGKTDVPGVVHWDIGHQSEVSPAEQPRGGPEIVGWVRELEVRRNGRAELWALTNWLPRGRELVKSDQMPFASIAIVFDAIDPVSGESRGPELTSIAITPQPFLQELPKLAASRRGLPPSKQNPMTIDFSDYAGRNKFERARSYLTAHSPGYDKLPYDEQMKLAFELGKTKGVKTGEVEHVQIDPAQPPPVDPNDKRPVLDLTLVKGRNRHERVIAALERREGETFSRLPWDDRFRMAAKVLSTHRIVE